LEKLNCHNLFLFEGNGAENKNFDISPEMAKFLSCYFFINPAEDSITKQECAVYLSKDVKNDLEKSEEDQDSSLYQVLIKCKTCITLYITFETENYKPEKGHVFGILEKCFKEQTNVRKRLEDAFLEINSQKN